jgi:hypothetical protein
MGSVIDSLTQYQNKKIDPGAPTNGFYDTQPYTIRNDWSKIWSNLDNKRKLFLSGNSTADLKSELNTAKNAYDSYSLNNKKFSDMGLNNLTDTYNQSWTTSNFNPFSRFKSKQAGY